MPSPQHLDLMGKGQAGNSRKRYHTPPLPNLVASVVSEEVNMGSACVSILAWTVGRESWAAIFSPQCHAGLSSRLVKQDVKEGRALSRLAYLCPLSCEQAWIQQSRWRQAFPIPSRRNWMTFGVITSQVRQLMHRGSRGADYGRAIAG